MTPVPRLRVALLLLAVLLAACDDGAGNASAPSATPSEASVVPGSQPEGAAAFLGPARRVRVGAITIGYRRFGAGPPLLLVAGQGSAMNVWGADLPRRLAAHFDVTMFDNRGVGYSTDQPDVPLTVELMADDTAGLIDALGLRRAHVLGWSTGGEIGLALAVRHPDKLDALVVSGATAGGPTTVGATPEADALLSSTSLADQARLLTEYLFPSSAGPALKAFVHGYLAVPAEGVGARTLARQAEAEARFVRSTAVYDALPRVRARVLVTNGTLDRLVPPQNARIIATRVPGARLELFEGAAHAMMFQDMDRFAALVEGFLLGHD